MQLFSVISYCFRLNPLFFWHLDHWHHSVECVCVCVSFSVSCMCVCDWICLCNIVEWRIYIFIKKLLVHVFCFKNMYFRGDSNGPPTTSQRNRCVWSVFTDVQNTQHSLSSLNSYTFRYIPSFLKQCLLQKNIHTLRIRWRKTIPKRKQ